MDTIELKPVLVAPITQQIKFLIIQRMEAQGVTQAELAKRLGKNERYVNDLLSINRHSKINNLEDAVTALGFQLRVTPGPDLPSAKANPTVTTSTSSPASANAKLVAQTGKRVIDVMENILAIQLTDYETDKHKKLIDDLGADSLDDVEIVMGLEEEFDIEISDETAESMVNNTIEEVVNYVVQRIEERA